MKTNHPAHGSVSLERLHQIREHLLHDTQYSNGGNRAYILADMLKLVDEVLASRNAEPVLPDEKPMPEASKMHAIDAVAAIAEVRGWNACRAAMLSGDTFREISNSSTKHFRENAETSTSNPVSDAYKLAETQFKPVADLYALCWEPGDVVTYTPEPEKAVIWLNNYSGTCVQEYVTLERMQEVLDGNSPVAPDGYVLVPKKLTAENGAKSVLSGEFSETKFINCPECFGDDDCETCDGSGRIEITVPVTWTTIKAIWDKGVEHFAAAPQQEV
ncbi:hypothetical protein AIJ09_001376 [Salmonella enterica subsp. enterica]|nr:hypothetical protein [Salmonella enterica]ECV5576014.1 hypothetical protein [Salmonella enterica subsp. enterica serovar Johannesburg]EEA9112311.1 hypothetical protein [Salmonella enterica subsp. enterica]EDX6500649.1 hypothetical protein [Salmonella enterica subsp. enterica serovar Johannesburg]EDY6172190.1 hypothetical protein [Salmonella enterica]